jgi:hypothetical protein
MERKSTYSSSAPIGSALQNFREQYDVEKATSDLRKIVGNAIGYDIDLRTYDLSKRGTPRIDTHEKKPGANSDTLLFESPQDLFDQQPLEEENIPHDTLRLLEEYIASFK